jgi:hypothetical protein
MKDKKIFFCILQVTEEKSRIRIHYRQRYGSASKCHRSPTLLSRYLYGRITVDLETASNRYRYGRFTLGFETGKVVKDKGME